MKNISDHITVTKMVQMSSNCKVFHFKTEEAILSHATCCACLDKEKVCRKLYTNSFPSTLYSALIRKTEYSLKAVAFHRLHYATRICDATGEKFVPIYTICLCDECYEVHIRRFLEKS